VDQLSTGLSLPSRPDARRVPGAPTLRLLVAAGLVTVAGLIVIVEPWHGPIVVSLVSGHGIDTGDLLTLPFLVGAALLVRSLLTHGRLSDGARKRGSLSMFVLGASLLAAQGARLANVDTRLGPVPYVVGAVVLAAAAWFVGELLVGSVQWGAENNRTAWLIGSGLLAGTVVDVVLTPLGGTTIGAIVLVLIVVLTRRPRCRGLAAVLAGLGVSLIVVNVASLTDVAGVDVLMAKDQGGGARGAAIGAILVVVGLATLRGGRRSAGLLEEELERR
jgi:hypothetical protein